MTSLFVPMPTALKQWVDARLAQGRYADAADYLRDLVRRDQESAEDDTRWLKAMIEEGLASGVIDAEPEDVIEEIIAEHPAADDYLLCSGSGLSPDPHGRNWAVQSGARCTGGTEYSTGSMATAF